MIYCSICVRVPITKHIPINDYGTFIAEFSHSNCNRDFLLFEHFLCSSQAINKQKFHQITFSGRFSSQWHRYALVIGYSQWMRSQWMNGKQDKQKQRTDAPSEKPKIHHRVILMRPHAVCHILNTLTLYSGHIRFGFLW